MDPSTALTLVQTILQVFDSSIYREVKSLLGYKSHLDELKATMSTIQAVLLNAEKQQMLQLPITIPQILQERLQEAVYQANDLFDEVTTVVQRKKLMDGNTVTKEVCLFFSCLNQPYYAVTMSWEIGKIRGILDGIARDHHDFGSMQTVNLEVKTNNPRETHSFVCAEDVIFGRDDDKRIVIDMLLNTAIEEVASVISIVGIGGLGKTTLAQLAYNDEKIVREFPFRMWVCVSDDSNVKGLNVKVLLGQILAAATNQTINSSLSMDQLQRKLREELNGKKFLLVLDDVWNEDHSKWQELRKLLTQGGKESRVIVTTRSKKVAHFVGSQRATHELRGLSDEESWSLFESMALEPGQVLEAHLIKIGKEIVRKCVNVPLAIRIVGSLVRDNPKESWLEYLKNIDLANMKLSEENGIVNVLKISYHYLPTHLKSCFTYCAVFPKDYRIQKDVLIELWMAQGFILPLDDEQSFEAAGEEYFQNLLQRCFFQDVEKDYEGGIISCKMHDLIHDLAKEVAGTGIGIKSSKDQQPSSNDKIRHFFLTDDMDDECYLTNMKRLRTFLMPMFPSISNAQLPLKMRYLRVLDLRRCGFENFLSNIGELLHLRYLDLSKNKLSLLPSSIIQLYNLQTLKLFACRSLKELPRNLRKLVNLRHLDIQGCDSLRHMPPGMNSMTSLHKLTMFVICKINEVSCCMPQDGNFGWLEDLKYLNHIRGRMEIKLERGLTYDAAKVWEGRYLINKRHLKNIKIIWKGEHEEDKNAEALLQGLQPHSNLRRLSLENYPGVSFPSWGDSSMNLKTCLPNLVEIQLRECGWLDHLPLLRQLRHLKVLRISKLGKLEYMESSSSSDRVAALSTGSTREEELVFFPSLEMLEFVGMDELKGWWKTPSHSDSKLTFPRLSYLEISECPKLKNFPSYLKLKMLVLRGFNRAIGPIMRVDALMPDRMNDESPAASTSTSNYRYQQSQGLREVQIDDVGFLKCQPKEAFQHLSSLKIWYDTKTEKLTTGEVGEVFQSGCLSFLRELEFRYCTKLKSIAGRGVWEQFTALETLQLHGLEEMELEEEEDDVNGIDADVPRKCLALTLRTLEISLLPKVVKLPKGMQHLAALQTLHISHCDNLEELPTWIDCLSSLQRLEIWSCKRVKSLPEEMRHLECLTGLSLEDCSRELKERCQEQTGADWPKIQHIPRIHVS